MTDQEHKDVDQIVYALKRLEWGNEQKCLVCGRAKAYGMHPCSCPVRLGLKAGQRLQGHGTPLPDDSLDALVAELRQSGERERDALAVYGNGAGRGDALMLVERAADAIEQLMRERR